MKFKQRRNEGKFKKLMIVVFVLLLIALGVFVYFSPMFEKNPPKMSLQDEIYWNLSSPLKVNFSDDGEIKDYKIVYKDEKNDFELNTQVIKDSKKSIDLNILTGSSFEKYNPKDAKLIVEVSDNSKWNFFMGNKLKKEIKIKVDKKSPIANVLANTYLIKQGGSAVVVVEVKDDNLKDKYISFNDNQRFELFPFKKENIYLALIAWPIDIKTFKSVNLVAIDEANNKSITKVPLYIKPLNVKFDKLKISDEFIQKVSKNVLEKSSLDIPSKAEDIFVKQNRDLRKANMETIQKVFLEKMNRKKADNFDIKVFKELRASLTFASYGERRHYYYKGKKIDEAWHLGNDWASIKKAKIYVNNPGKVIFDDYLGIYGDAIIIDHGFGLGTLYAHTSRNNVDLGQEVKAGEFIANTGSTGAVFGDHLHFGVLIQGIEVNPNEWLSRFWLRENVIKIIDRAMKVIDVK